jgi:hypothetical protein
MDLFVFNSDIANGFAKTLISFTTDTIVFEGYFNLEDGTMPVERIIQRDEQYWLIEIYQKKTVTSEPSGSGVEAISFFPLDSIELKYKLIKVLHTHNEYMEAKERINGLEAAVLERDEPLRRQRLKREHEEMIEECKKMDFKTFLREFCFK